MTSVVAIRFRRGALLRRQLMEASAVTSVEVKFASDEAFIGILSLDTSVAASMVLISLAFIGAHFLRC